LSISTAWASLWRLYIRHSEFQSIFYLTGRSSCPFQYQERTMLDLFFLAVGLCFFVLAAGYAYACDRL
jgi:hypothetical protein